MIYTCIYIICICIHTFIYIYLELVHHVPHRSPPPTPSPPISFPSLYNIYVYIIITCSRDHAVRE